MKRCTLPELADMAANARIEYTQHVCPVHRIHTLEDLKNVPLPKESLEGDRNKSAITGTTMRTRR